MWNGKRKAITLSYDDGVMQDKKLVEIFDKYGMRATFNVNSGMLYNECIWQRGNVSIVRMNAEQLLEHLGNHEIAVHGLTHCVLGDDDKNQTERQIVGDKVNLERIFQKKIHGMAYPGGKASETAIDVCRRFGIQYARKAGASRSFDIPADLLSFNATINHSAEDFLDVTESFLKLQTKEPKMLFVWGHSYEFDIHQNWELMHEFCKMVSNREDIFYGTNHEVLSPFYK